jgi:hypothetical protein
MLRASFARMPICRISVLGLALASICRFTEADVIVLSNRTGRELPVRFMPVNGLNQSLTLRAGENLPLYLDGKANLSFSSPGGSRTQLLDANCAYFFGATNDGRVQMQKIGLGEDGTLAAGHELPGSASRAPSTTIPVRILVDEEEPARRSGWENRLRRRVEAASAIFDKYFHVKLQVVAVGTWNSDNGTDDFNASLSEFEREVSPSPARLAIGFSSQWKMVQGRIHMAGTRGPLHTHILAREGNPEISEPEKLEYLVHELGHYLGAAHCPERGSVMRPILGDNQAGRKDFRIQFDPVNTLAIGIISEEMRRRNLKTLAELSPETKKRLGQIYMELARALPDDPAAFHYAQLVRSESGSPIVVAARQILQQIVRAAVENRALPLSSTSIKDVSTRRQGDELTSYLIREAARAADSAPAAVRQEAFLLAITIGLSDSQIASQLSAKASVLRAIEAPSERAIRLAVLGEPTIRGRRDLAQHFLSAAQLAATNGVQAAQAAGLVKELADSQGVSGFSFADVAADRAGVRFAQAVLEKKVLLGGLAVTFSVPSYMPEVEGLPEKVPAKDLALQFGGKDDPRFLKQLQAIDQRISALPAYRPAPPVFSR